MCIRDSNGEAVERTSQTNQDGHSDDIFLMRLDAETGKTHWVTTAGDPDYERDPTLARGTPPWRRR